MKYKGVSLKSYNWAYLVALTLLVCVTYSN